MHKIDFTNVLDLEIERLEKTAAAVREELSARIEESENADSTLSKIDKAINKRRIAELEGELRSKTDYLSKLKEKKMLDTSELDKDYDEMIAAYQDVIKSAEVKINDPHDNIRLAYLKGELELWIEKPAADPSKKEASVFYFKAIKDLLADI